MGGIERTELDAHLAALERQRAEAVENLHRIDGAIAGARCLIDRCSAKAIQAKQQAALDAAAEAGGDPA
jgi:hypothetical protein